MVSKVLSQFNISMASIALGVVKAVHAATEQLADDLAANMRDKAPVESGALQESIQVTHAGDETPAYSELSGAPGQTTQVPEHAATVTAGDEKVNYAGLVNYGSIHNAPNPFFTDAVNETATKASDFYSDAVNKALNQ